MNLLESRIRELASPSDLTATERERLWISTIEMPSAPEVEPSVPRRARWSLRPAVIMAAVVLATGGVAFGASETVRSAVSETAIDAIDVFRGQDHTTPLSPDAEQIVRHLGESTGMQEDQGRTLATATRGRISATVSAVPTEDDELCLTMVVKIDGEPFPGGEGRGAACIGPLDEDRPIGTTGANNSAEYRTLGGIALDDVTKIEVYYDGRWEQVEMTGHAFAWVGPTPQSIVGALRATMKDGRSVIVTTN